MKKERKEDSFIRQPYYKGGDKALSAFVSANLQYPIQSREHKIEGDVHIRYDINHKGDVIETKIIGGLDDLCNEEAVRVVKMLKFIVPKTPRHLKVTFHKNIRIHFHLHEILQPAISIDESHKMEPNDDAPSFRYTFVNDVIAPTTRPNPVSYNYVVKIQ